MIGVPLKWMTFFLENRTFLVKVGETCSSRLSPAQGRPQGSKMGLLMLILYIDEISMIAQEHRVQTNVYAEDTTFYIGFGSAGEFAIALDKTKLSMDQVNLWMLRDFFRLNLDRTKVLFLWKTYPY